MQTLWSFHVKFIVICRQLIKRSNIKHLNYDHPSDPLKYFQSERERERNRHFSGSSLPCCDVKRGRTILHENVDSSAMVDQYLRHLYSIPSYR